jgi:hypothetical protein
MSRERRDWRAEIEQGDIAANKWLIILHLDFQVVHEVDYAFYLWKSW